MTVHVDVRRRVALPDDLRVSRCRRVPELGPRILFFSGGTAIRDLSRAIKLYTHNTIHLITPFDSGGSSAVIRDAFDAPSIGDLRNRLMALADETIRGNPEIYRLFAYRFENEEDQAQLVRRIEKMVVGAHPFVASIPDPLRHIVCTHLRYFRDNMPADFDLRGASVGNLVLIGGYLNNDRDIDSVIFLFSKLVAVLGTVRLVTDVPLHLAARLADGTRIVGQHALTGKEVAPLTSRIEEIELVKSLTDPVPESVAISDKNARYISQSDLICYPMGSLWTSVVANLLPQGTGRAIVASGNPKIYIANTGKDPEQVGMTIGDSIEALFRYVAKDAGPDTKIEQVVNYVLVDSTSREYDDRLDTAKIRDLGVELIDLPLVDRETSRLDPVGLAEILISLS